MISDIHSNLEAFRVVIASLPAHDSVLCLGDVVGYGPQPNEVVEELQQLHPIVVLMGNHDNAVVTGDTTGFSSHAALAVEWTRQYIKSQNLDYLSQLHPYAKLELDNSRMALYHGSPRDPLSEYVFPGIPEPQVRKMIRQAEAAIVLLGHTHVPMVYTYEDQILGNPGSVGQPRDGDPRASYAILTLSDGKVSFEVKRVAYNVDKVAKRILQAGLPRFLADRLYIGL